MAATSSVVVATVVALVVAACGANDPAPQRWQRSAAKAERSPYGAWIQVKTSDRVVAGELLAVSDTELLVADRGRVASIAIADVIEAVLSAYQNPVSEVATLGTLGAITTVSHGFWLVFSLPVWAITAGSSTKVHSGKGFLHYPRGSANSPDLRTWRKWARFPQGLPSGFAGTPPASADTPTADQDRGDIDQPCYPNRTCNGSLVCLSGTEVCRPRPGAGQLGGRCYGTGQCEQGLMCANDRCVQGSAIDAAPAQPEGDAGP